MKMAAKGGPAASARPARRAQHPMGPAFCPGCLCTLPLKALAPGHGGPCVVDPPAKVTTGVPNSTEVRRKEKDDRERKAQEKAKVQEEAAHENAEREREAQKVAATERKAQEEADAKAANDRAAQEEADVLAATQRKAQEEADAKAINEREAREEADGEAGSEREAQKKADTQAASQSEVHDVAAESDEESQKSFAGHLLRLDKIDPSDTIEIGQQQMFSQRATDASDFAYASNMFLVFESEPCVVCMRVSFDGTKARVVPTPFFLTNYSLDYVRDPKKMITSEISGRFQISEALLQSAIATARDYCENASSKNRSPKRPADCDPEYQPPAPKVHRTGTECSFLSCPVLGQPQARCCGVGCRKEYHRACQARAQTKTLGNQLFCASCAQTNEDAKKEKSRLRNAAVVEKKREERLKAAEKETRERERERERVRAQERMPVMPVNAPVPMPAQGQMGTDFSATGERIFKFVLNSQAQQNREWMCMHENVVSSLTSSAASNGLQTQTQTKRVLEAVPMSLEEQDEADREALKEIEVRKAQRKAAIAVQVAALQAQLATFS